MSDKFSILYVDDEETNLRIFKNTFRREYNIFTAVSAKEGIEILLKENIDVILSDQRMPEMTGVEFLKYTKEAHPKLNRILITGYTDFSAIEGAINDAKIFQYIQKPWQEKDLRNTIEEALRIYILEQENVKLTLELTETNENLTNVNLVLKNTNEELLIAKNKAEESDRLKSVFFANISHELRTPMNGIIGFSEILTEEDISDEQRNKYLTIIVKSCKQLINIMDDIIEVSRLATSKVKVQLEAIDMNLFFNTLVPKYKNASNEKVSIIITNELSETENNIISDKHKLNKILCNLIENAIKYTEAGYVKVLCAKTDNHIVFSVEDSGIGIGNKMQDVIFNYFRQENESLTRPLGGLGLGLSIVRENVKLLGGDIVLKSEKGKGSTFLVRIPYKSAGSSIKTTQKNRINKKINPLQNKFTVLIVEDERINTMYLETILAKMNLDLNILSAQNGQEALDICKKNNEINLVLMDIKMPIMNGIEAMEQIKKIRKDLPIIAQSAYTAFDDIEKAKLAGCDDFITKPIDTNVLLELITKYHNEANK